ncbi:MAG: PAS domain S-box protein, partial [Deltaproteobacteria bacterium]|nr:PAS domain S-box protein [Deltaproteobacteria bacterium]
LPQDILRASMFLLVASVVAILSGQIARREETLRESEETFRLLSEQSLVGIMIFQDAICKYVNQVSSDILEYSTEEILEWGPGGFAEIVHPDNRSFVVEQAEKKQRGGEDAVANYDFRTTTKTGKIKWIDLYSKTISFGGRNAVFVILLDITDRKLAEEKLTEYSQTLEEMVEERTEELRDAQEQLIRREKLAAVGQLAGSVGHELRNPLGIISNAVYYLKMIHPDADDTTKEYMEIISSEVRTSEKIISDLLDFSRIRQGKREAIAVTELVTQALGRQAPPDNIEIVKDIPSGPLSAHVDSRQIVQILTNLLSNAYQAMPEGGSLTVRAENGGDTIHLSFTDTGSGIPGADMGKIFEPLFTSRARGIGLGLAVSRNLIESNGGTIEVRSEEGRGSTFTVTLPAREGGS